MFRDLALYRLLAFGAMLMVLMIFRPQGLLPARPADGGEDCRGVHGAHRPGQGRRQKPENRRLCVHTVVLGAGAVGVATAHYLSRLGHAVTVIERQPGAALETSFGNGAVIHASEVEPWSQPGMPLKILKWLGREDAPMLLRPGALPHVLRWGTAFLRQLRCRPVRANAARQSAPRSLQPEARCRRSGKRPASNMTAATHGVLKIYRDPDPSLTPAAIAAHAGAEHGLVFEELSPAQCAARGPALEETGDRWCGALYFPRDEVGDCHKFVQEPRPL